MKNQHIKHILELTFATLLISTSGVLGRYIDMPTPVVIWWRSILAFLFLLIYCRLKKINLKIQSKKDIKAFIISALFMAVHWITYFYALKLSNVAIGMLSMFTFPIMTTFLEPVFNKSKLDYVHVFLGFMVLIGIYILAPNFDLENNTLKGILFGLFSALCYALRNLILKQHVKNYHGSTLMMYQLLIMTVVLSPVLIFMESSGIKNQYPFVILLALVTTAIGHTLFIGSLRHFKVSTASIIGSSQPVFGIVFALIFLNEIPSLNTFIGGSLILATVIIESLRSNRD